MDNRWLFLRKLQTRSTLHYDAQQAYFASKPIHSSTCIHSCKCRYIIGASGDTRQHVRHTNTTNQAYEAEESKHPRQTNGRNSRVLSIRCNKRCIRQHYYQCTGAKYHSHCIRQTRKLDILVSILIVLLVSYSNAVSFHDVKKTVVQ